MTKAVFSLPHSFSWMFSADKLFTSKTKPGEISLLLKSSVGSLSLIFISLFSRFILPLRLIGIKWLLKLCKHTLPYRSRPCIDSECVCVCVFPSVSVPIYACLTVLYLHWCLKSLWVRDTGSRLLCTLSTFTSLCFNNGVCVCVCLSPPVCICMYITLCMPACADVLYVFDCVSLCAWISLPMVGSVFTYCSCFISPGFWTPEEAFMLFCDNNKMQV